MRNSRFLFLIGAFSLGLIVFSPSDGEMLSLFSVVLLSAAYVCNSIERVERAIKEIKDTTEKSDFLSGDRAIKGWIKEVRTKQQGNKSGLIDKEKLQAAISGLTTTFSNPPYPDGTTKDFTKGCCHTLEIIGRYVQRGDYDVKPEPESKPVGPPNRKTKSPS